MNGAEIIIKRIEDGRNMNKPLIIAIDGRCAAGNALHGRRACPWCTWMIFFCSLFSARKKD